MEWLSDKFWKFLYDIEYGFSKSSEEVYYYDIKTRTFQTKFNGKEGADSIIICVISDTHERHRLIDIPSCDILIHAGDIAIKGRSFSKKYSNQVYNDFNDWIGEQPAKHKIIIGGNHDKYLQSLTILEAKEMFTNAHYLFNESVSVEGLNIWGSPFSKGSSLNNAFQSQIIKEQAIENLNDIYSSNCKDVDIIITHGPWEELVDRFGPKICYIFGHLHGYHGINKYSFQRKHWISVSAPIMNHRNNPTQLPILLKIDPHEYHLS